VDRFENFKELIAVIVGVLIIFMPMFFRFFVYRILGRSRGGRPDAGGNGGNGQGEATRRTPRPQTVSPYSKESEEAERGEAREARERAGAGTGMPSAGGRTAAQRESQFLQRIQNGRFTAIDRTEARRQAPEAYAKGAEREASMTERAAGGVAAAGETEEQAGRADVVSDLVSAETFDDIMKQEPGAPSTWRGFVYGRSRSAGAVGKLERLPPLKRAVVFAEILGRPKALEDEGEAGW